MRNKAVLNSLERGDHSTMEENIFSDDDLTIRRAGAEEIAFIEIDGTKGEIPHELRQYQRIFAQIRGEALFEVITVRKQDSLQLYCRETTPNGSVVAKKDGLIAVSEYGREIKDLEENILRPDGYDLIHPKIIPGPLLEFYLDTVEAEG